MGGAGYEANIPYERHGRQMDITIGHLCVMCGMKTFIESPCSGLENLSMWASC